MHIFHTSLFLNSFSLFSSLYRLYFNCDSVCRTLPLELGRLSFDVLVIHCPWFWPFTFPGHPHNIDRQPLPEIHYQSSLDTLKSSLNFDVIRTVGHIIDIIFLLVET